MQSVSGWKEKCSIYTEKKQGPITFNSRHQPPMASRSYPKASTRQCTYLHPFRVAMEGTLPLPSEDIFGSGVGQVLYCTHHTISRDKRTLIRHKTRRAFPTQGDAPSTGLLALRHLVRRCSKLKAHSYAAEWEGGPKTPTETPFSNSGVHGNYSIRSTPESGIVWSKNMHI